MTLFDEEAGAAPTGPTVRVRMTVAYDGAAFHGFAPNPGVATVGGTLLEALDKVLRQRTDLTCAGRTDRGVHGWGQVVSFDAPEGVDLVALQRSLNGLCGPRIVVREAEVAPPGFDARFSATGRRYRYTVLNRPVPDPFLAATAWHVPQELSMARLRLACDPLIGEHDFSSFCRAPKVRDGEEPLSLRREVRRAEWVEEGGGVLRFWIEASAFCHQMVRSIVGTLVDVGLGKLHPGDLTGILAAQDRSAAGPVAPPHGLCLWEVHYHGLRDPLVDP